MILDSFSFTHKGGRSHNEDSVGGTQQDDSGIFVVADGLGGHLDGEVASQCVVNSLTEGWTPSVGATEEAMRQRIAQANEAVLHAQEEAHCTMKSTVVALQVSGTRAVWGNTGDSRLYVIHNGKIVWITEDHSVAFKRYRAGELTREQMKTDPDQSRLLRALGNPDRWEPDIKSFSEFVPGDGFLLCTDGAWEFLSDEEVLVDCLKADSARQWAELLLLRMMPRFTEERDNLTVMTVLLQPGERIEENA